MPGMTTKSSTLAIAACALLLGACASAPTVLPPYQAPAGGAKVKLSFHGRGDPYAQYRLVTYTDPQNCDGGQQVANNSAVGARDTVTALPADRFVTFSFLSTGAHDRACAVTGSFLTRADHAYGIIGVDEGGKCSMAIQDVTAAGHPFVEPSLVGRRMTSAGRCVPLATIPHWDPNAPAAPKSANAPSTLDDFKSLLPAK